MKLLPSKSIKLICTDPPHSDRIPYLELSELWNSILNKDVHFNDEIIVSNAKERNKNKKNYNEDMKSLIKESSRILTDDGLFLLYYNARDKQSWKFMEIFETTSDLHFVGAFPMEYSANSVVQDNRKGGMKTDYVLVMKHKNQ
jgi:adenine-specific DNA methylase